MRRTAVCPPALPADWARPAGGHDYHRSPCGRLVVLVAIASLVAAADASAVDRDHWINAISIDRAELGWPARDYRILFGKPLRTGSTLSFPNRQIVVLLDKRGRGGSIETTNPKDKTLDAIGPCSTEGAFLRAYPDAPHYPTGYKLGRLFFLVSHHRVTSVSLTNPTFRGVMLVLGETRC
jgi:hypothetical protein